jgi:hypothetical protein
MVAPSRQPEASPPHDPDEERFTDPEDFRDEAGNVSVALVPERLVPEHETLTDSMDRLVKHSGADQEVWGQIRPLLAELRLHSPEMYDHSLRVGFYVYYLTGDPEALNYASAHDLGKLGISREVLHWPDTLDEFQTEGVQRHPAIGAHYLKNIDVQASRIAGLHHKFQPDGYGIDLDVEAPGLGADEKEDLIAKAKLVMLVDSFDAAMTRGEALHSAEVREARKNEMKQEPRFQDEQGQARIDWLFEHRIEHTS